MYVVREEVNASKYSVPVVPDLIPLNGPRRTSSSRWAPFAIPLRVCLSTPSIHRLSDPSVPDAVLAACQAISIAWLELLIVYQFVYCVEPLPVRIEARSW